MVGRGGAAAAGAPARLDCQVHLVEVDILVQLLCTIQWGENIIKINAGIGMEDINKTEKVS